MDCLSSVDLGTMEVLTAMLVALGFGITSLI
jgi:hypothetical protein